MPSPRSSFGVLLLHGLVPGPGLLDAHAATIAPMFRGAVRRLADGDGIGSDLRAILPPDCGYQSRNPVRLHRAGIDGRGLRVVPSRPSRCGWRWRSASSLSDCGRFGYPIVPMLMGVILGPYLEEFLRRSLIVSKGDPLIFPDQPGKRSVSADDACLHLVAADQAGNDPQRNLGRTLGRTSRCGVGPSLAASSPERSPYQSKPCSPQPHPISCREAPRVTKGRNRLGRDTGEVRPEPAPPSARGWPKKVLGRKSRVGRQCPPLVV